MRASTHLRHLERTVHDALESFELVGGGRHYYDRNQAGAALFSYMIALLGVEEGTTVQNRHRSYNGSGSPEIPKPCYSVSPPALRIGAS